MDYIKLKKTLMAVFDHFLSCHDIHDLEQMMQAFEAGKGLNIRLPEKIHRNDYQHDVQFMAVSKPKTVRSRVRKRKPKNVPLVTEQTEYICDVPIMMDLSDFAQEKYLLLRDVLINQHHKIQFKKCEIHDYHGLAIAQLHRVIKPRGAVTGSAPSNAHMQSDKKESISPDKDPSSYYAAQRDIPQSYISQNYIQADQIPNDKPNLQDEHSSPFRADISFEEALRRAKAQGHTEQSFREKLIEEISKRIKKHKDPP